MKYQQQLQVAVRERLRRLMIASFASAGHEVHLTVAWIKGQPALRGLLEEAGRAESGLDRERFRAGLARDEPLVWPSRTEEGRATLVWELLQDIAAEDERNPQAGFRTAMEYSNKSNLQDSWREFAEDILQPLFDFLGERVGATNCTPGTRPTLATARRSTTLTFSVSCSWKAITSRTPSHDQPQAKRI
ncbi:hypothetical protein ABZ260_17215 [Streptosporangium sp. NPDC006013]|uniref:hypothetical protein n=1 Tax=Streptosporangium sp. NPDC006013 TaxID=3155596 RepID=UPI0033B62799